MLDRNLPYRQVVPTMIYKQEIATADARFVCDLHILPDFVESGLEIKSGEGWLDMTITFLCFKLVVLHWLD